MGRGSGGGGSGGGNSGEGDNNAPTEQAVFEFINQIEDPCLSSAVNRVLNDSNSMRGVIADIIEDLDSRSDVQINIIDGDTSDGSPGQAVNPWIIWEPDSLSKLYTATIVLDNNYMIETSQEGAIAVLIHEILHTYIAESNLLDRRLDLIDNNLHHQIFADKCIN